MVQMENPIAEAMGFSVSINPAIRNCRGRLRTSPRSKNSRIIDKFGQIRNILQRADEGIGPYEHLFRESENPIAEAMGLRIQ
ncbi:MAG: hypothetical protein ACI3W5_06110 [Faecousia sp.]